MCQYRSVPSFVAIRQFPCHGEPNKSHFRFYEVTSGFMTSPPAVPLWSPLGVSIGLCQVWWQSDNCPARESQIRLTSYFGRSLPVLWRHFRYPMCQYRSVPSLVAIGQFPCPGEPNKSHFLFLEVTSGSVTSLPVPLWSSLGVNLGLCKVWSISDRSPAVYDQRKVSLRVQRRGVVLLSALWRLFRFSDVRFSSPKSRPRCPSRSLGCLQKCSLLDNIFTQNLSIRNSLQHNWQEQRSGFSAYWNSGTYGQLGIRTPQ